MNKSLMVQLIGWAMLVSVITLSLIRLPQTSYTMAVNDKWLHLSCYFILTYWFLHAFPYRATSVVWGLSLIGLILEILQSLTGYRFLEWLDMVMNLIGVLGATVVFYPLNLRVKYLMPD